MRAEDLDGEEARLEACGFREVVVSSQTVLLRHLAGSAAGSSEDSLTGSNGSNRSSGSAALTVAEAREPRQVLTLLQNQDKIAQKSSQKTLVRSFCGFALDKKHYDGSFKT